MKRALPLLLAVLGAACGGPPAVRAAAPAERDGLLARCLAIYPQGDWRVVHAIHADMPGSGPGAFVGVTAASDDGRGFRSILLSLEGMVLLDATWSPDGVVVERAVPPLDQGGFAEGMAADVRLLFLPPPGHPVAVGATDDGETCRWADDQGNLVDVTLEPTGDRRIVAWDADGSLRREVRATGPTQGAFTARIVLTAPGNYGYELDLDLLEVEDGGAP